MPTEKKTPQTQREAILVNILERLSGQLKQFEERLEEIEKNQLEMPGIMEKAGVFHSTPIIDGDSEIQKLQEAFQRYRSDMLSLVNQQDKLDESIKALYKRQGAIIGAQEVISRDTASLDERFGIQEKAINENTGYLVRQGETFVKEIDGVNRSSVKLHLETEKHLKGISGEIAGVDRNAAKLYVDIEKHIGALSGEISNVDRNATKLYVDMEKNLKDEHRETQKQLDELRRETTRRLLALDKIESTLEILMIRTEPHDKKPFFLVRAIRKVIEFFKVALPGAFKNIKRRRD